MAKCLASIMPLSFHSICHPSISRIDCRPFVLSCHCIALVSCDCVCRSRIHHPNKHATTTTISHIKSRIVKRNMGRTCGLVPDRPANCQICPYLCQVKAEIGTVVTGGLQFFQTSTLTNEYLQVLGAPVMAWCLFGISRSPDGSRINDLADLNRPVSSE